MFYFRGATVFCLGYRLSKHKMTGYSKNLGSVALWPLPGYACVTHAEVETKR